MVPSVNWRFVYLGSIGFRLVLALSNSYIHPDEHFQSMEVLGARILGFHTKVPWEFGENPARSLAPLYIIYGPLLYLLKLTRIQFTPLQIWYILRLQNVIIGWLITDKVIYSILPTKPERIKGVFFTSTSYITLVYQAHLFSNSVETWLLMLSILIIDHLRFLVESPNVKLKNEPNKTRLMWLGFLVALGFFNRVTFPAFLLLPFWYVARFLWINKAQTIFLALGFVVPTIAFIVFDTIAFGGCDQLVNNPKSLRSYIIAPLNNLLYNTSYQNLAHHGIHPYYTHLLVNLPQLMGPSGLLLLMWRFKNKYWKTIPFMSVVSGLLVLSVIPHQELRFLIPVLPMLCCCFDLASFNTPNSKSNTEVPKSVVVTILLYGWYIFNVLMAVLMGVYHQGGVVPALDYIHSNPDSNSVYVWWRTYSPPTWILGDSNSYQFYTLDDDRTSPDTEKGAIIDTMGCDVEVMIDTLKSISHHKVYLVTPTASFNMDITNYNHSIKFNQTWSYTTHLDMDHIDINNWSSLQPGLGIYQVL